MQINNPIPGLTNHAMLVVWGVYARQIGLIKAIEGVKLHQKKRTHTPQTKIIEFLVAIMAGLAYLKDISRSAHPLDQDQEVVQAWQQPDWADYSGVSRTLSELTQDEAEALTEAIDQVSQPFIDQEVMLAQRDEGYLMYDGDLTGRPVSPTSHTYPGAAFGHMGDRIELGYQAALVSLHSPTYGRLWLSVKPHPGDKVSCTQMQAMVHAAEATTGVRPRRRTQLLEQRIEGLKQQEEALRVNWEIAGQKEATIQVKREKVVEQMGYWQQEVERLEAEYEAQNRLERTHNPLGQARRKLRMYQARLPRRDQEIVQCRQQIQRRQAKYQTYLVELNQLYEHLQRLKKDNLSNPNPVRVKFRIDAGFGTVANVDWLIEMGYELYTKPFSHRVAPALQQKINADALWERVGGNAQMTAWADTMVGNYAYPLNTALVRYHIADTLVNTSLLHYGDDPVLDDLTEWFQTYNSRQTIEAGIKEGKGVFQMHHLKVRAEPALFLQEQFACFAANFVRWNAHSLAQQAPALDPPAALFSETRVKQLVLIAAHTSAWVFWQENGCLLRFTDHSLYAGQSLLIGTLFALQLPLPLFKSLAFY